MSPQRGIVLTSRFVCELAMLVGLGYLGFEAGDGAAGWLLGTGTPALAIALWGAFIAPKARWPVSVPIRLGIEALLEQRSR